LNDDAVPCLFSEWISTSDASMSSTTASAPTAAADGHTRARVLAIAAHSPSRTLASMPRNVRYSVESDGTSPNRPGWARKCSMSAQHSPPPASISIACTNTLPRSCGLTPSPLNAIACDN
jgi:hypothetical protein